MKNLLQLITIASLIYGSIVFIIWSIALTTHLVFLATNNRLLLSLNRTETIIKFLTPIKSTTNQHKKVVDTVYYFYFIKKGCKYVEVYYENRCYMNAPFTSFDNELIHNPIYGCFSRVVGMMEGIPEIIVKHPVKLKYKERKIKHNGNRKQ